MALTSSRDLVWVVVMCEWDPIDYDEDENEDDDFGECAFCGSLLDGWFVFAPGGARLCPECSVEHPEVSLL